MMSSHQDDDDDAFVPPPTQIEDRGDHEPDHYQQENPPPSPILSPTFRAEIASVYMMLVCLRGISNGKRGQLCQVDIIAKEGMRFTCTDNSKSLQGRAIIPADFFVIFDNNTSEQEDGDDISFRVNLPVLLDCLSMAESNTRLRLRYNVNEKILGIQLCEGGGDSSSSSTTTTTCTLKTLDDSEEHALDFVSAFLDHNGADMPVNKAVIPSDRLRDALLELADTAGASHVRISTWRPNSNLPRMRMSVLGQSGSCDVDFAGGSSANNDDSLVFGTFEFEVDMSFTYHLTQLLQAAKPLGDAVSSFFRMNAEGMLSIQHRMMEPSGTKFYVDYYLLALDTTGGQG
jgi:hypothetical protein